MSLNQIKANIVLAFAKIGTRNGTARPESSDNRFSIAYEYFVADTLASIASKRKENAKKAAETVGLLSIPKPGDTVTCYENEHLQIIAKTNSPAQRLDPTILSNELSKLIGVDKARAMIAKATVENKPATSYSFVAKV
jgi:hypothetical protein